MKRSAIFLFLFLMGALSYFWVQSRWTQSPEAPSLTDTQIRAADLMLLESDKAPSSDLRAALGRHWKRDFSQAYSYAEKWLNIYPEDLLFQEMLLKSSLDVTLEEGLQILDLLLPEPTHPRLLELRIELRARLDPAGTANMISQSENSSPAFSLILFESGDRSEKVLNTLFDVLKGPNDDDALTIRVFKAFLGEPATSAETLSLAKSTLSSPKRSSDLRVALYRLLERHQAVFLTTKYIEDMIESLPHNNKIQLTRSLVLRCRSDRDDLLRKWSLSSEPLKSAARDVIQGLETEDPCR